MIRKAFPDATFAPDVVVSDGEYVIGRWTMTATNTGTFDDIAESSPGTARLERRAAPPDVGSPP